MSKARIIGVGRGIRVDRQAGRQVDRQAGRQANRQGKKGKTITGRGFFYESKDYAQWEQN